MFKQKNVLKWVTPLLILLIVLLVAGGIFFSKGVFASGAPSSSAHTRPNAHPIATATSRVQVTPTATARPSIATPTVTARSVAATPTGAAIANTAPTATPAASNTTSATGPVACATCWHPGVKITMQWQLSGTVDQSYTADMYDIDMFDNSAAVVSSLHAKGYKVTCYIDAGTWENWRSDASQFPASVKGSSNGWAGEVWLDIRQISIIGPLLQARMDQCNSKGFDAVEFDNVDGYANDTGFPLTANDQLTFNEWLANQAHTRNLSVALKNDTDQVTTLLPYFDWALDEQCFEYDECDSLTPFITAGKPVMDVEYNLTTTQFCSKANSMNINAQKKSLDLGPDRTLCR